VERERKQSHLVVFVTALQVMMLAVAAMASPEGEIAAAQVSKAMYRHYLDDMLYTRAGDSRSILGAEHDLARDNIAMLMESFGLTVTLEPFDYDGDTYYNVVGTKLGTVYPSEEYVIGAHYDSGNPWPDGNFPGADDNASGVVLVLEAARVLSGYASDRTIRFVAFDVEEWGLVGAWSYVEEHFYDNILGMISADMVSYDSGSDRVMLYGFAESDPIKYALSDALDMYSGGIQAIIGGLSGGSDHYPFEVYGFEACLIIESANNSYYHTGDDNVDMPCYIDYEFAAGNTRAVVGFLVDHAGVQVSIPDADFDVDGDVDADDFTEFEACFTGPGVPVGPPCSFFDFDSDDDVDCTDLRMLDVVWTGPPAVSPDLWTCVTPEPESVMAGSRCMLITPPVHGEPFALRVDGTALSEAAWCISEYVQADGQLNATPVFQTSDAWGTVLVCDDKIIPDASFIVRCDFGEPGIPRLSDDACVDTPRWGDPVGDFIAGEWTPPNDVIDFLDISSVVDAFRNLPTAPAAYRVALVGPSGNECSSDLGIDFLDISGAVDAFKGSSFSEALSCPMPCE